MLRLLGALALASLCSMLFPPAYAELLPPNPAATASPNSAAIVNLPKLVNSTRPVISPAALWEDRTAGIQPPAVVLPEGTRVCVTMAQDLRSDRAQKGDSIRFAVAREVWSPDGLTLLIPAGTPAVGSVEYSSGPGMFGRSGKLRFTCDYLLTPDGVHVPLRSLTPLDLHGDDERIACIASTLMMNHMGFLKHGGNVVLKPGDCFEMVVAKTTPVVYRTAYSLSTRARVRTTAAGSASHPLLILKDGAVVTGALVCFDGSAYTLETGAGRQTVPASDVTAAYRKAEAGATPASYLFVRNGGDLLIGTLLSLDDGVYTVVTDLGTEKIRAGEVRSLYGLADPPVSIPHRPSYDARIAFASSGH